MSRTQIEITARDGSPLGIVPTVAELVPVMRKHPDATYTITAIIEAPCALHPSFEADYCPTCGTLGRDRVNAAQSSDLHAALVSRHYEAHQLLKEIEARIDAIDPETADWGHVGDLGAIVELLRQAVGAA